MSDNITLFLLDTNNVSQVIEYPTNKIDSWLIMERAPGCSLKEFVEQKHHNDLEILEAVQLVQQLLIIVKRIHFQDVIHNNLEPKHIMIEWDKKTPIEQAHLTVISFSQAFIKSDNNDDMNAGSKQNWYRPPQANAEGLQNISSVDASSIGALLFWLITKTAPQHNYGILPHQQDDARHELENKISKAVRTASKY
jgi:serine/threonine protein kinase